MEDIEFYFIGWCIGTKNGVKSDKMWTAFKVGGNYYAAWGARGKAIRFKLHPSYNSLMDVMRKKQKDYEEVDKFELFTMFLDFEEKLAEQLTFSILTDKVM